MHDVVDFWIHDFKIASPIVKGVVVFVVNVSTFRSVQNFTVHFDIAVAVLRLDFSRGVETVFGFSGFPVVSAEP